MSYGATVKASTTYSSCILIKLKTYCLPLSLINSMYTATFQCGLLTILEMPMNFISIVCLFVDN